MKKSNTVEWNEVQNRLTVKWQCTNYLLNTYEWNNSIFKTVTLVCVDVNFTK